MSKSVPPANANANRQTRTFRRSAPVNRPTPEQLKRQNDVLRSAWRHFGEPGLVIAFLNTRDKRLNGQPLHLALESAEGLTRVEALLEEMTLRT